MIGPFWGQFGPKRAILGTLVTEFFLGTSKFEIYMKKQSRIRREMVVLGGVRRRPLCRLTYLDKGQNRAFGLLITSFILEIFEMQ